MDGDVDTEESKGADVVGDVEDGPLDVVGLGLLALKRASFRNEAFHGDPAFAFVQKGALSRAPRHEEGSGKSNKAGKEAFEEEDIAPFLNDHG